MLKNLTRQQRKAVLGYIYISPWILGFLIFVLGPMVASFVLSFTDYSLNWPPNFIGLRNYVYMFTGDKLFWSALARTFYFASLVVILGVTGSLFCALVLNAPHMPGVNLLRTIYFIPSLTPLVALAIVWGFILQPRYGLLNSLLAQIGIDGPGWLRSPDWAIIGLLMMNIWGTTGGQRMTVFLAGLQGVPKELYDAAAVDGAGVLQQFRHVTLPMLSPTLFYNLIVGMIAGLRAFAGAFVTTGGGPAYATWFYILHLYTQGFTYLELGYASALAWFFFVIVLGLTLLQFKTSRRWVFYGG